MNSTKSYNILCATDDNYVPYCGIMLTSLFDNNKEHNLCVYIFVEQLNNESQKALEVLGRNYNQRIEIVTVDHKTLSTCPIRPGDHVSIVTYYRLLAPILLPSDIDKILYLDCDMIVNGYITSLYNENIDDCPIAMSKDEAFFIEEKYRRLDFNPMYAYKNAGVALINLRYWRDNDLAKKCLDYISIYPDKVKFHDQDTLNAILHKEIKQLPIKYNLQTGFLLTDYTQYYEQDMPEILDAIKSPVIIHFTGASKPWFKGSRHPYRKRFIYYKSISLWATQPLKKSKSSLCDHIIRLRNEIIWALGIKKRPETYILGEQK